MLLSNKTAVLTGCNRGIGKKILEIFSENRANIYACVRNNNSEFKDFVENLKKKYNNKIIPVTLDLNNESNIKEASKFILSSNKPIDVLINNAAEIHTALFQMTTIEKLKELFEVNFFSQTLLTQYILKSMIKNKSGSIIYISSTSGIDGNEGRSAYSATKAAILSQAKVLSKELGVHKIRVNTIAPGLTNTDMMNKNTTAEAIKNFIGNTSLKRVGETDEIANVALFLASNLSTYISGQVIRVDGGM